MLLILLMTSVNAAFFASLPGYCGSLAEISRIYTDDESKMYRDDFNSEIMEIVEIVEMGNLLKHDE